MRCAHRSPKEAQIRESIIMLGDISLQIKETIFRIVNSKLRRMQTLSIAEKMYSPLPRPRKLGAHDDIVAVRRVSTW